MDTKLIVRNHLEKHLGDPSSRLSFGAALDPLVSHIHACVTSFKDALTRDAIQKNEEPLQQLSNASFIKVLCEEGIIMCPSKGETFDHNKHTLVMFFSSTCSNFVYSLLYLESSETETSVKLNFRFIFADLIGSELRKLKKGDFQKGHFIYLLLDYLNQPEGGRKLSHEVGHNERRDKNINDHLFIQVQNEEEKTWKSVRDLCVPILNQRTTQKQFEEEERKEKERQEEKERREKDEKQEEEKEKEEKEKAEKRKREEIQNSVKLLHPQKIANTAVVLPAREEHESTEELLFLMKVKTKESHRIREEMLEIKKKLEGKGFKFMPTVQRVPGPLPNPFASTVTNPRNL